MMWVVACRNEEGQPVIYDCVRGIQKFHPDDQILIVDSDSPDKRYMEWAASVGCAVADIKNRGYAHGAFKFAIRQYPDEEFYCLIFDSIIVNANLDFLKERPFTALRHWTSYEHDWGHDKSGVHLSVWGNQQLQRLGIPFPGAHTGIMGPVFFAQRDVIFGLDAIGYWDRIEIHDAWEHCGLERVAGIALEFLDVDVTQSLQGRHIGGHFSHYDESVVSKIPMARA